MGSRAGINCVDLWSELDAADQHQDKQVEVFYRRRKPNKPPQDLVPSKKLDLDGDENRPRASLAAPVVPIKRISWNRSLSTRGRISIAIGACFDYQTHVQKPKRKGKPPTVPKGNLLQPPNFEKERVYFEEVDAFELLEESPSPKNFGTWVAGNQTDVPIPHLSSRLEKWLFSKKSNYTFRPSSTLSKLLRTPSSLSLHSIQGTPALSLHSIQGSPSMSLEPIVGDLHPSNLNTPKKSYEKVNFSLFSVESKHNLSLVDQGVIDNDIIRSNKTNAISDGAGIERFEVIETSVKKLSLAPTSASLSNDELDPFVALLAVCGQSSPTKLLDVFSKYCGPKRIFKLGEGTFGEAFMAGNHVCKIVPVDGDLRVNGEVQKRSEELLEEVVLSRTLNSLKGQEDNAHNICTTFIETTDLKVCQGPYDSELIKAWEDWDEEHGSENDHPQAFPEKQRYVVFVLEHGGKDLESFVLLNFNEARTLLVQVTAGLAVAEAAYEFEHRDLHWGNILLKRNDSITLPFILEGKQILVKTFGLSVSIIDFTLSRMNTGDDILFLDLSSDPYLFKGPKGDKQAETYRKMKEITEDCWEGSFPKTNLLWLLYLVDILLLKKSFERTSKDERELRYLKKRLDKYQSAKEAISDPFFSDLFVPHIF